MFDLAALNTATEAVHELELLHPDTKEPMGLFIAHKATASPSVQEVANRQANRMLRKQFASQRKGKDEEPPTIEQYKSNAAEILAAATVRWFERDAKGKEIDGFPFGPERKLFSPEAAQELYANPGFIWLRDQLNEAVDDLGNFIKT
ncbi:MAG: hypothetical protein RL268_278 [Pseudomonadota bacterium]|jgi:hypothetical protein